MAVESVWMADRLTNEQLDIYISRLPFFEREVFYLYALNDFSYDELSRETGIPKSYLYQTVKAAKDELRKSIIRL
jgi:DNA-directed RNA polymerase specialized sigma24 family protein